MRMVSLKVKQGSLPKVVHVPSSKSYANRALILAALKPTPVILKNIPNSTDVTILLSCLKQLGLEITTQENGVTIKGSFPACETQGMELNVGEGGTTARFLAAMLLKGTQRYNLILGERLKERPWNEFIQQVRSLGGVVDLKDHMLSLQGPLKMPATLEVDCERTTQFATAFELSFPETKIVPKNLTTSQSYWAMTGKVIEDLKNTDTYHVPLDWSSASYPLAFAALNHEIKFPALHDDSYQADAKFLNVLRQLGAVQETSEGITVSPIKKMEAISLDVTDALDLVPTLGYFLSHVEGTHELHGTKNLTFKESDRLTEVTKLLKIFGCHSALVGDTLVIQGSKKLLDQEVELQMPNDHRMVMVGALFLRQHAGGFISPPEAVTKSYPDFFELFIEP